MIHKTPALRNDASLALRPFDLSLHDSFLPLVIVTRASRFPYPVLSDMHSRSGLTEQGPLSGFVSDWGCLLEISDAVRFKTLADSLAGEEGPIPNSQRRLIE